MIRNQSIFISHSSVDNDSALLIHKQLRERGYKPWLAVTDVPPGANYARTIMEALESASAILLVLTEAALKSDHVAREVEVAVSQKIPIFPINMSGQKDVQPLLTKEWRYWLAIVQVLNAPDTSVAVNMVIEAINNKGLEIGQKNASKNENQVTQNKLQLPSALQANKIRSDQAERIKREQDAKAAQERLKQEARERERVTEEKARKEQEQEKLKLKEKEEEEANLQRKLASATPRTNQAQKIADWLQELSVWLAEVAEHGPSGEINFDYFSFRSTFDKNFKVDLKGIEDLAKVEQFSIGHHLLSIYRTFVQNLYLINEDVQKAKPFLDLSLDQNYALAFLDIGEWYFAQNGVDFGRKYFINEENRSKVLTKAREHSLIFGDGDKEQEILDYQEIVHEWKWLELVVQLADKKIRPDKLNSLFQEIDQTLSQDSMDINSKVYLSGAQRVQWKFLGAYILYKLERNTAARNFLRGLDENSEEYSLARSRVFTLLNLATKDAAEFVVELIKVIDSWR